MHFPPTMPMCSFMCSLACVDVYKHLRRTRLQLCWSLALAPPPSLSLSLSVQCKLIVCQMSNTRCQPLSWLLVPMALVVLLVIFGVVQQSETALLYMWTAVVVLAHIHYGVSVVCTHTRARAHTPSMLKKCCDSAFQGVTAASLWTQHAWEILLSFSNSRFFFVFITIFVSIYL